MDAPAEEMGMFQVIEEEQGKVWQYDYENNEIGEHTLSDTVPVGIYPGLEIDFKEIMKNI
ncbi:MAG: hypothetical protein LUI02_02480 [Clostridiales bacterium]|nr:hypothetical protein [Clostridiales bacterium]